MAKKIIIPDSQDKINNLLKKIADSKKAELNLKKEIPSFSDKEETLLKLANEAYTASTDYLRTYKSTDFKDAHMMYNSEHTKLTKFFEGDRKYNHSKFYIPKVYEFVTSQVAFVIKAIFGSANIVNCTPYNEFDKFAKVQSDYMKVWFDYMLKQNAWFFRFVTSVVQEGHLTNFIAVKNYYDFETKKPVCMPIATERIRVHPSSNVFNIVEDSPYLINVIPMFWYQVKAKMKLTDNDYKWNKLSPEEVVSAINSFENEISSARNNYQSNDSTEGNTSLKDHQIVYIHENFIRDEDGEDYCFYSLGCDKLLSKVYKTKDLYFHGRPFKIGHVMLEANKVYPTPPIIHAKPLQEMLNELQNMSIDIKKKVTMPIYLVDKKVKDLYLLESARPGSMVKVNDPQRDVVPLQTPTQVNNLQVELNTVSNHFDDLVGKFSPTTNVDTNGASNSVGGLQSMSNSAGTIQEMYLACIVETVLEPCLLHYAEIQNLYSNPDDISEENRIFKDYGIADKYNIEDEAIPQILAKMKEKTVRFAINAGQGAFNPDLQFQKIIAALRNLNDLSSNNNPNLGLNIAGIAKLQLGALGIKNISDIINVENNDPEKEALKKEIDSLKQQLQTKEFNPEYISAEIAVKQAEAQLKQATAKSAYADAVLKAAQTEFTKVRSIESGVKAEFSSAQTALAILESSEAAPTMDAVLKIAQNLSKSPETPLNDLQEILPETDAMVSPMLNQEPTDGSGGSFPKSTDPLSPISPEIGLNRGIENGDM